MKFLAVVAHLSLVALTLATLVTTVKSREPHTPDATVSVQRNFSDFQVIRTSLVNSKEQYQLLVSLTNDYDFWLPPRLGCHADIMVSSAQLPALSRSLQAVGLSFFVKVQNVEQRVEADRETNVAATLRAGGMNWLAYQRWSTIEPWILSLEAEYPDVARKTVIGQTYEGRNIYMIQVSNSDGLLPNGEPKRAILIDGNIHAREWVAGATASWILNELVTNSEKYKEVLDTVDFYIIPLLNIDGYEYTHTTNRMWRKTRKPNAGSSCVGCDPNRNFGFQFAGEGTSDNPCSEIFHGGAAFSQPEAAALADALRDLQSKTTVEAYITFHSYGQFFLYSWGYKQGVYPDDFGLLSEWGKASVDAIEAVSGKKYTHGQGADTLYGVGGASDDYAKSQGVKFSTTVELRDTGNFGFMLPANQILDTAKEAFAGVLTTVKFVAEMK